MFVNGEQYKFPRDLGLATIDAANFARNYSLQDTIYGMCDPGVFHFSSSRRTIALNGLIGNREIMNLILAGQPEKIVEKYNVKYYGIITSYDELKKINSKPLYLSKRFTQHKLGYTHKDTYVAIFKADEFFKYINQKL